MSNAAKFEVPDGADDGKTYVYSSGTDSHVLTDMATQAELDAHAADTTSVHGIADTSVLVDGDGISSVVKLTQAEYDALTPDAATLYVISDGPVHPPAGTESATTFTLAADDDDVLIRCTNASATTCTVPTNASVALPIGFETVLFAEGAGGVTLSTTGITLAGSSPNTTISQNEAIFLKKVATDTWVVIGGTAA